MVNRKLQLFRLSTIEGTQWRDRDYSDNEIPSTSSLLDLWHWPLATRSAERSTVFSQCLRDLLLAGRPVVCIRGSYDFIVRDGVGMLSRWVVTLAGRAGPGRAGLKVDRSQCRSDHYNTGDQRRWTMSSVGVFCNLVRLYLSRTRRYMPPRSPATPAPTEPRNVRR